MPVPIPRRFTVPRARFLARVRAHPRSFAPGREANNVVISSSVAVPWIMVNDSRIFSATGSFSTGDASLGINKTDNKVAVVYNGSGDDVYFGDTYFDGTQTTAPAVKWIGTYNNGIAAISDSNGNLQIAVTNTSAIPQTLNYARLDHAGAVLQAPTSIFSDGVNSDAVGDLYAGTDLHWGWFRSTGVMYGRTSLTGTILTPATKIAAQADGEAPSITFDGDGFVHMVWLQGVSQKLNWAKVQIDGHVSDTKIVTTGINDRPIGLIYDSQDKKLHVFFWVKTTHAEIRYMRLTTTGVLETNITTIYRVTQTGVSALNNSSAYVRQDSRTKIIYFVYLYQVGATNPDAMRLVAFARTDN